MTGFLESVGSSKNIPLRHENMGHTRAGRKPLLVTWRLGGRNWFRSRDHVIGRTCDSLVVTELGNGWVFVDYFNYYLNYYYYFNLSYLHYNHSYI